MDALDSGEAFAEKLGEWVHFADAIALSAVHGDGVAGSALRSAHRKAGADAVSQAAQADFHRVRSLLETSIAKSFSSTAGKMSISLPAPEFDLPLNLKTAFTPYRRFYEAHQRDMDMHIRPLRSNLREAAAKLSPALKKLADLDAMMERILAEREGRLMAKVPALLAKRFERSYTEHQQKHAGATQADDPAGWVRPGSWLAQFRSDMQALLLAELELRMQPSTGLCEAISEATGELLEQTTQ